MCLVVYSSMRLSRCKSRCASCSLVPVPAICSIASLECENISTLFINDVLTELTRFWACILPVMLMTQIEPLWISNRRIFIRESSSRIYSPYVFAIGQLLGEIPYSVLCAFVYWVLMVWPMGIGQGAAGTNGNGFMFLVILFVEFFGSKCSPSLRIHLYAEPLVPVTFGQFIGAISPNIQVSVVVCYVYCLSLT